MSVNVETLPFEINLRLRVISVYRPPWQNSEYFLFSLTRVTDYFANTYNNRLTLGDFNLEPTDSALMRFLDSNKQPY